MANGLAEVSRIDMPEASTKSDTRNGRKAISRLAGKNRTPPRVASPRPVSTPAL
jgi:hypothetical protein